MWQMINEMPDDEQAALFDFGVDFIKKEAHWKRDKNIRDILIHLYEWHQLLLKWVHSNLKGEMKAFLPEPYNWKTYGEMNLKIWKVHQATSFEDAKKMLLASHKEVMSLIEQFSNEELFEAKHFCWTGTTTLGSYCISNTSSHYDWAIKKLKMHAKTYSRGI